MVNVFFFLISFFTTTGMLNANFYVKVFAFEFILAFITILYAFKKRNRHCTQNVTYISLADLFITLILCAYLYHGIGTHNILDTFWPLAYFLFYYFLRLNGTTDPSGQWTHIAPWVISAHLLLCVFQYFSWIPNHNSLFTIGSTFGNPDMLSTYLASMLLSHPQKENIPVRPACPHTPLVCPLASPNGPHSLYFNHCVLCRRPVQTAFKNTIGL